MSPNSANVYVVRNLRPLLYPPIRTSVDGNVEGFLGDRTHLLLVEAPGNHVIRVDARGYWAEVSLHVEAGKNYFLFLDRPDSGDAWPFTLKTLDNSRGPLRLRMSRVRAPGVSLHKRDLARSGETELHVAAWRGDRDAILALIAGGLDVNGKTGLGWTPVMFAASQGHVDVVDVLLRQGAMAEIVEESMESQLASALVYMAAAQVQEKSGARELARGAYEIALLLFNRAAKCYGDTAEGLASTIRSREIAMAIGESLKAFAQAVADMPNYTRARWRARESAQIDALRRTNKTGTGYEGYVRAVQIYTPLYTRMYVRNEIPQFHEDVPLSFVENADISTIEGERDAYAEMASRSRLGARQCREIVECYTRGLTAYMLSQCVAAALQLK
jgi:ankyrin repeat protein